MPLEMRNLNKSFKIFLAALMAVAPSMSYAKKGSVSERANTKGLSYAPALIKAENLDYDSEKKIATATGNVEITQGNRTLLADKLTYDKENSIVTASGHVALLEPTGTVIFAETMTLNNQLKRGVIKNFATRLKDKSLIAAREGEKISENKIVLRHLAYSPCSVCKEHPDKAPLWQIRAKEATIDSDKQRVSYKNAFLDLEGIPIIYTPYFSHPTPDADRKSGFLTPKYSSDHVFGAVVKTPYYYNIAPDKDATITPIFTTNEGIIMAGEYRKMLINGKYELKGSITDPQKVDPNGNNIAGNEVRGHFEGTGEFNASEYWTWGFDGKAASDDTYLKRYHFGDENVLTSKLYASRIENNDHILVNNLAFQGLQATDDQKTIPVVLPYVESHNERRVGEYGTNAFIDTNILALTREQGVSSKRVSLKGGVLQPYVTKSGSVFEAGASIRGDGYVVDNVIDSSGSSQTLNGTEGRAVPQASLKWSLPLLKSGHNRQYTLEPITKFIVSPYGGNPGKIPNEDSQDIEFSDTNLFDNNHFTGYDIIESGPRVNYGLRAGASDYQIGDFNMLFGQSYKTKTDANFNPKSGLAENFSDYVGKVSYNKNGIFDVAYKFRFDKDNFDIRNNTVSSTLNDGWAHFSADYVRINETPFISASPGAANTSDNREVIIAGTKLDLNEQWQFNANGNRDLVLGQWVSTKSGFVYKGDCVNFSLEWVREYTRDRDIVPSSTISFQFSLKNMGPKQPSSTM
jgi:LPS-assembly protein